jgi:NAD(P)-dependent dehydrogenase (short-subunit alcohol dehydrogenase family)
VATRPWTSSDIGDLSGRTFVVTGGNSGLGYETARALARKRARVVIACRDAGKAQSAIAALRAETAGADVSFLELDLASLASVRKFADAFRERHRSLHVLVNNAGVMALPQRRTADGFEMQFGTNHLGHFALTGLLLELLLAEPGARIVTLSSTAHRPGRMRFDDLQRERGYSPWPAYAQSKLANLLFTLELQRRLDAAGASAIAVACHPGYAATNLQTAGPRMSGSALMERAMTLLNRLFAQSAEMGALPSLYAACAPGVKGGDYVGPGGLAEIRGHPVLVSRSRRARDTEAAARLWEISERLTGVRYAALS